MKNLSYYLKKKKKKKKTMNEEFKLSPMQFFFVHFNQTLDNNNMAITSTIFGLK